MLSIASPAGTIGYTFSSGSTTNSITTGPLYFKDALIALRKIRKGKFL
jgi:hypothetical protein